MKLVAAIVLLVFGPLGLGTAYADSDGYYCIGRGYLAYQFGLGAPPTRPHRLTVIRFGDVSGIEPPAILELPQFQVHGMQCGEDWIELASFTGIYRVTLDANSRPLGYTQQPFPAGQSIPQDFIRSQIQNLSALGGRRAYLTPLRVRLSTKQSGGEHLLEITARALLPVDQCVLAVTSRIVETDSTGREVNVRILFQGPGRLECGE